MGRRVEPRWLASPNHDGRPIGSRADTLILHYTGMPSAEAAIARLRDPAPPTGVPVSSHYVVEEDGTVWQLVADDRRAWHAGVSFWRGRRALNAVSIGIEIVNPGHEFGYRPFPALQLAATCDLCLDLIERHAIAARAVVGHSDVAPDRKQDPGELFPWDDFAANGVGLWPTQEAQGDRGSLGDALRTIGYDVAPDGHASAAIVTAFQRHWLPSHLSGEEDSLTQARAAAVAAAVTGVGAVS